MHIFITLFVFLAGFAPCSKALQYYASYRGFFKPKYGKHFEHLSYANPLAPKGGQINLAAWRDSFDSFNPYVLRGNPAEGLELLHATLMTAPLDDPNVVYPYLAESIHICPEHTHVIFALRKDATFHDGSKITSKDVVFSFQLLKQFGLPHFSLGLAGVEKATRVDRYRVKFTFKTPSKTLPFFLAKLPVFSKEYYKSYAFQESSLVPPLGSGPYQIDSFRHGDFIRYRRVRKWWGRALPVNAGLYNFDTVTYHYFKNKDAVVEALARNVIDHHREWKISRWHNDYNFQAVQRGDVLKKSVKKPYPHGLNALFMNARKPHLKDRRIRKALNLLFNFEWLNHTVFMNHYVRNKSLFMDTGFGAQGCPSEREKEILDGYDHTLYPPEARSLAFKPVQNAPSGVLRVHFEEALNLFR